MYTKWWLEMINFTKDTSQADSFLFLCPDGNPRLCGCGRYQCANGTSSKPIESPGAHIGKEAKVGLTSVSEFLKQISKFLISLHTFSLKHYFLLSTWVHIKQLLFKIPWTLFDSWKELHFLRQLHKQIPSSLSPYRNLDDVYVSETNVPMEKAKKAHILPGELDGI